MCLHMSAKIEDIIDNLAGGQSAFGCPRAAVMRVWSVSGEFVIAITIERTTTIIPRSSNLLVSKIVSVAYKSRFNAATAFTIEREIHKNFGPMSRMRERCYLRYGRSM